MRPSGTQRWTTKRLEEIGFVASGGTPLKSDYTFWDGQIPWYSSGELNADFTTEPKDKITDRGLSKSNAKVFPTGSLLIGMYDTAAMKMSILDRDAAFNQAIAGIKPSEHADLKFVKAMLEALKIDVLDQRRGTRQKNLSLQKIKSISVPLPPLEEQKRIVAVLDQAFAALDRARAHAEANLADAEALFVRLAYDNLRKVAETGKFAPVGEISDHCLGKMLDRSKNKGTFRPYLRNINVRWFEVDTSDILEMRIEDRELDRYEVRKGDLLICEGGYPGRASIYEGDARTYFQKALHRVRFSDESLAKVLMYWLFVEDKLGKLKDCFSGTGISHFTGKTLASYLMPMSDPPTNARAVENIDRHLAWTNSVISGYRQKLTDLANLRQSLLQKAFSGELT